MSDIDAEAIAKAALGTDWRDTESAARRVAEHAADEIVRLRAEHDKLSEALAEFTDPRRIIGGGYVRLSDFDDLDAERDRLRDALERLIERADDSDDARYGTMSTTYVRDIARAALKGDTQ